MICLELLNLGERHCQVNVWMESMKRLETVPLEITHVHAVVKTVSNFETYSSS